jgi:hypothetical protein
MDLNEKQCKGVVLIQLAVGRARQVANVNAVINIRVP